MQLTVTFTASNTVRTNRPYTIYEIEVRSHTTMPWLLYKRYRDFHLLHQNLQKYMSTTNVVVPKNVQLPHLPPKRLVRSLAPEVVAKRQRELQFYIQKLLESNFLTNSRLVLDFLNVPESLRISSSSRRNRQNEERKSSVSREQENEELTKINSLLRELSLQKNRVRAISRFEKWYFNKQMEYDKNKIHKPILESSYVRKFLIGDKTTPGLVHSCRLFTSKVAWRASINLLTHLLDIERCKDAPIFEDMFLRLDKSMYREMELSNHVNNNISQQEDVFKIIKLIKDNRPEIDHEYYVNDKKAWNEFLNWEK